jgi:hypothetical protein
MRYARGLTYFRLYVAVAVKMLQFAFNIVSALQSKGTVRS